jgi:putative ABC transport system permease protein
VDGSFTTGGACAAMMILAGYPAWLAVLVATLAGVAAGFVTGMLHTRLGIPAILSGILTQFALYSVNLHIMGMSANKAISVDRFRLILSSRHIPSSILVGSVISLIVISLMYWYFGTEQGSAIRATGSNPSLSKALGINIDNIKVLGLALSNGLIAMSGSLLAQYQGFADINMGRGAIVIGLAAVIIGEVIGRGIMGKHLNFFTTLLFIVIGGVIYYLVVVIVLWLKLDSNDLKLFTAVIVAVFLAVPYFRDKSKSSFRKSHKNTEVKEHA